MLNNRAFIEHIDRFAAEIFHDMKRNGFHDEKPNKGEMIALMHTELSETLEALRHGNPPDKHLPQFPGEVVELSDTIIRILHYCARFNLPIGEALVAKFEYNKGREFKHGKAF